MARPSKLTDKLRDDLCERIESPMPVRHACAMVGLGESTFHEWMNRGANGEEPFAEFAEAVTRARAVAAQRLIESIEKRATGFEVVRTTRGGEEVREWDSDWKAAAWLAERMFPDEFGNRQRIDHTVENVAAGEAIELTEEAQDAARAFLRAAGND